MRLQGWAMLSAGVLLDPGGGRRQRRRPAPALPAGALSRGPLRLASLGRLVAVAFPLYLVWEILQTPAFTGSPADWRIATMWCGIAALGDVAMAVATFAIGAFAFGDTRWFVPPTPTRYATVVLGGLGIHGVTEWVMVHRLHRWGYADMHPVVPVVDIGALPVLQPLVILPVAFWLLARWERR